MDPIEYQPIGIIRTPFTEKASTPIQGVWAPDARGTIEIFPEYARGLSDIEGFSHLILLYHFHLAEGYSLLTKPFMDRERKGIFSIRYFERPNPIGLSVVRLEGIEGNVLSIAEVDMLDGTPLLDIKPYVPDFDYRPDCKTGWYRTATDRAKFEKNRGIGAQ